MQDYILDKIITKGLRYNFPGGLDDLEATKLRNMKAGLEPMSYFFFKLAYEDDRRFGMENIHQFDSFDEFLPVSLQ